jgi:hypothetical protein
MLIMDLGFRVKGLGLRVYYCLRVPTHGLGEWKVAQNCGELLSKHLNEKEEKNKGKNKTPCLIKTSGAEQLPSNQYKQAWTN